MQSVSDRMKQYRWFHSIDLGDGVVTPGAKTPERHKVEAAAFFDGLDLTGKSVIDIGAWNGFYSFEAERRGAARVVACDHFCWLPSVGGRASFDFANGVLKANVAPVDIDVPNISPQTVGKFDVVLFLGVFYHLKDPIDGLARAASICSQTLIVETHVDLLDVPRPAMVHYPTNELAGDPTNWWGPNPACVVALMEGLGFSVSWQQMPGDPSRGVFHGTRR